MGLELNLNLVGTDYNNTTTSQPSDATSTAAPASIFDEAAKASNTAKAPTPPPASPPKANSDKEFEAFTKMTEKTTGKKLENLTPDEFKAAMKAFKASRTVTAPAPQVARLPEADPNNKAIDPQHAIDFVSEKDNPLSKLDPNMTPAQKAELLKKVDEQLKKQGGHPTQ